ncbi:MAG: hypothetical protein OHK0044_05650 [Burkholderiaceae bacterium]
MVAQSARTLAADGWRVVQIDLYGCGDSAGDFGAASWAQWLDDLEQAVAAHHRDGALWLWGLRAGALLLPPLLERYPMANLLLWQPEVDGTQTLNQFLRLRTSAALLDGPGSADRKRLREQLAHGQPLEIAGYTLAPNIANPLAEARLTLPPNFKGRVLWCDVVDAANEPIAPARQKVIDTWRGAGHEVRVETPVGPKFWQTVEIAEATALLERTRTALACDPGAECRVRGGSESTGDASAWPQESPYRETATWIGCEREGMLGVVCARGEVTAPLGVLIVVGGPQYRVGSHRQFVRLARTLASAGFTSLRFDVRGMGDSEGKPRNFTDIEHDLAAAIDALSAQPGIRSVAIWALCDAASAALMFCAADSRVCAMLLVNPWVRSEVTLAKTHLKHYYRQRLLQRDFWSRLLRARFDWRASLRDLSRSLQRATKVSSASETASFQTRMANGWRRFAGQIALVLSGRDYTAKEFLEYTSQDPGWHGLLTRPNVCRLESPDADHTFSSEASHRWLEEQTIRWLRMAATPVVAHGGSQPSKDERTRTSGEPTPVVNSHVRREAQ